MPDYRPVDGEDLSALRRMRFYAFAPEDGPTAFRAEDAPEILGSHRGLFDGGELLSCCSYHDFRTRVRGSWLRMGGVAGVATPPEHRRQGLGRQLMGELLAEFREEGLPLSALWPFDYEFYARLGWAHAHVLARYEVEPADLASAGDDPAGTFRRLTVDDYDLLEPVFASWQSGYELATGRDQGWWRRRIFERFGEEEYVYAWEHEGDVRAYVVYHFDGEGADRTLSVWELAAADPEARRQLWRFLADHDSQVGRVKFTLSGEHALLEEVADPSAVECSVEPGPMVRLVSVSDAIESIAYPEGIDGEAVVSVSDSLADWNDGTFAVSFADGRAACEPAPESSPDVRLDVSALSQLVVGSNSLDALVRLSSATVADSDRASVLAAAFPERSVFLSEAF